MVKPIGELNAGLIKQLRDDLCEIESGRDVDDLNGPKCQFETHWPVHRHWELIDPLRDMCVSILLEAYGGVESISQDPYDYAVDKVQGEGDTTKVLAQARLKEALEQR